jgi:hypothetical protein
MKVQDRVQAMNKVIEQEEVEPLEMTDRDSKCPRSYPKRSSVVEMWKRRESAIKKVPSSFTTYDKSDEKEEILSNEEYVDLDVQRVDSGDFDDRQQDKLTATSSTVPSTSWSSIHVVTPERSGPETDDSNSNVGSGSLSTVRRSNIRDSWKKRAPPVSTFSSPSNVVDQSLNASLDSLLYSPVAEYEPLNAGLLLVGSPAENKIHAQAVPFTPSPSGVVQSTGRKMEESKPQHTLETVHSTTHSSIVPHQNHDTGARESTSTGSTPSSFDELRSKWAKFGVQQEQAGAAGRVKPSVPSSIATQSPKVSTSRAFQPVPKSFDTDQNEAGGPQLESPSNKWKRAVDQRQEAPTRTEECSAPNALPNVEEQVPMGGDRKSQLVKMGQLHASRPKADVSSSPRSLTKRCIQSKYCPSLPQKHLGDKTGTDFPLKRNALQKPADATSLLRAKHRRRTQQAQSIAAAAARNSYANNSSSSTNTTRLHNSLDDSFPVHEMQPNVVKSQSTNVRGDTLARPSLPMRTLFGSQSGESLELGPPNEFPDQNPMIKIDVMRTIFDSWSEMESFSAESPHVAPGDARSGKVQLSSSSLTNSALKKLREKRQKSFSKRADSSNNYSSVDIQEPITPLPGYYTPVSETECGKVCHPFASPETLSAVSQNIISDTSFSNLSMKSTYETGNSRETTGTKSNFHSVQKVVAPDANDMIPDCYASEKNTIVPSFRTADKNLIHKQIPEDTKDQGNSAYVKIFHDPTSPETSSAVSQSIESDTSFSNSYMQSTFASGNTKETSSIRSNLHSTLKDVVPNASDMIPDEFVSEKNASVKSFRSAYENLSLEQIAKDMKEEASSALRIDFLSHELLNKSMNAAGASLNKLVAGEIFNMKKQNRRLLINRATSPVEEVAIEVEYIGDDSEDER